MRSAMTAVLLALGACNNVPDPPPCAAADGGCASVPCETAGGHCILGFAACSNPGPQGCGINPGAGRCCFDPTPGAAPTAGATVTPVGATRDAVAEACAPSGCTGSCADLSARNVMTLVGGCVVWHCCAPSDGGVGGEAGDADGE